MIIRVAFAAGFLSFGGCAEDGRHRRAREAELAREVGRLASIEECISTHPLPSAHIIDKLEAHLAKQPCVGRLDKWERTYFHGLTGDRSKVDGNKVEFSLREAGRYDFKAGHHVVRPDDDRAIWFPDDRPYQYASGIYDVATRQLKLRSWTQHLG